eukprot:g56536.t1
MKVHWRPGKRDWNNDIEFLVARNYFSLKRLRVALQSLPWTLLVPDTQEVFPSGKAAEVAKGCVPRSIHRAINRGWKAGGHYWEYLECIQEWQ